MQRACNTHSTFKRVTPRDYMKIILVIHGYPMRYNAGSEVYTQALAHALAAQHDEVHVFSRQQNKFLPDYIFIIVCLHRPTHEDLLALLVRGASPFVC